MRYAIGAINVCPRCGGKMEDDMPLFDGTMEQHIVVCGNCYDLLHDRFARHRKAWIAAYWQDEFDTVIRVNDERMGN